MRRYIYIGLLSVILLTGCTRHVSYPETILQAEICMDAYPDSALHLLSNYGDSVDALPDEAQMYYHLLTIQAKDKLYITHTDDSLINRIVRFYEKTDNPDRLMLAYYYQGSVYRDMNDAPRALKAFQQVVDMNRNCPPSDLMARTYNQMGTLFAYQGLYDESLEANRQAARQFLLQEKKNRTSYAYRDMARMFDMKEQKDSALFYYQKAHSMAVEVGDSHRIYGILGEMAGFYFELGQIDTAKLMLLQTDKYKTGMINVNALLGDVYMYEEQWDSVQYYLKRNLLTSDIRKKYFAYKDMFLMETNRENLDQAVKYMKSALSLQDSIAKVTKTETVAKINTLYNYQHTEKENADLQLKQEQQSKIILFLVLGLLLLIVTTILIVLLIKWKHQTILFKEKILQKQAIQKYEQSIEKVKENEETIRQLDSCLEKTEKDKKRLENELLKAQKELLEKQNAQIVANQKEQNIRIQVLKESDIYVLFQEASFNPKIKIGMKEWSQLDIAINETYPNFSSKLRELYPNITLHELHLCYLLKISIPLTGIANLFNYSKSAVTNQRTRLFEKLFGYKGKATELDKFISEL